MSTITEEVEDEVDVCLAPTIYMVGHIRARYELVDGPVVMVDEKVGGVMDGNTWVKKAMVTRVKKLVTPAFSFRRAIALFETLEEHDPRPYLAACLRGAAREAAAVASYRGFGRSARPQKVARAVYHSSPKCVSRSPVPRPRAHGSRGHPTRSRFACVAVKPSSDLARAKAILWLVSATLPTVALLKASMPAVASTEVCEDSSNATEMSLKNHCRVRAALSAKALAPKVSPPVPASPARIHTVVDAPEVLSARKRAALIAEASRVRQDRADAFAKREAARALFAQRQVDRLEEHQAYLGRVAARAERASLKAARQVERDAKLAQKAARQAERNAMTTPCQHHTEAHEHQCDTYPCPHLQFENGGMPHEKNEGVADCEIGQGPCFYGVTARNRKLEKQNELEQRIFNSVILQLQQGQLSIMPSAPQPQPQQEQLPTIVDSGINDIALEALDALSNIVAGLSHNAENMESRIEVLEDMAHEPMSGESDDRLTAIDSEIGKLHDSENANIPMLRSSVQSLDAITSLHERRLEVLKDGTNDALDSTSARLDAIENDSIRNTATFTIVHRDIAKLEINSTRLGEQLSQISAQSSSSNFLNDQRFLRVMRGLNDTARITMFLHGRLINPSDAQTATSYINHFRTLADANYSPSNSDVLNRETDLFGLYGAVGARVRNWNITAGPPSTPFPAGGSLIGTSPAHAALPGTATSWKTRVPDALPSGWGVVWVNNKDDLCAVHAYNAGVPTVEAVDLASLPHPPQGGFAPQDFLSETQLADLNVWQNDHWLNPSNPEPKYALMHTSFENGTAHYDALMPIFEGHPAYFPQGRGLSKDTLVSLFTGTEGSTKTFYPNGLGEGPTHVMIGTGLPIDGDNTSQGHISIVGYDQAYNHLVVNPAIVREAVGGSQVDIMSIFNARDFNDETTEMTHTVKSELLEVLARINVDGTQLPVKANLSYSAAGTYNRVLYGSNVSSANIVVDPRSMRDSILSILPQASDKMSKEAASKFSNILCSMNPTGSESLEPLLERLWRMYFSLSLGAQSVPDADIMGNPAFMENRNRRNNNAEWVHDNTAFSFGTNPLRPFTYPYFGSTHDILSSFMGGNINNMPPQGRNPITGASGLFPDSVDHYFVLMSALTLIDGDFPYLFLPYNKVNHRYDGVRTNTRSLWTIFNLVTEPNCGIAPTTHLTGANRFTDGWGGVVQHDAFVHGLQRVSKILFMSPQMHPISLQNTQFTQAEATPEAVIDAISFLVHNYELGSQATSALSTVIRECFRTPHIAATELAFDMPIRFNSSRFHDISMRNAFVRRIGIMRLMTTPANWGPAAADERTTRLITRMRADYAGVDARDSTAQLTVNEQDAIVRVLGLEHVHGNYDMAQYRAALHDTALFEADIMWYEATSCVPWFINTDDPASPIALNDDAIDHWISSMPTARMVSAIEWMHDEGNARIVGNVNNVFGNRWRGGLANNANTLTRLTMVLPNVDAYANWSEQADAIRGGFYRNRDLDLPLTNLYNTRRVTFPTGINLIRNAIATNYAMGRDELSTSVGTTLRFLSGFATDAGATQAPNLPGIGNTRRMHFIRRCATLFLSLRSLTDAFSMENKFNMSQISAYEGELLTSNFDIDQVWQSRTLRSSLIGERRPLPEYLTNFASGLSAKFKSFGFITEWPNVPEGDRIDLHVPSNETLVPDLNADNNYGDKSELALVNWVSIHPVLAKALHFNNEATIGMVSWVPAFNTAYVDGVQQPWANWAVPADMDRRGILGLMRIYGTLAGYNYHINMSLAINSMRGSARLEHYQIMRRVLSRQVLLSDAMPYTYQNSLDILWFIDPVVEPFYDAGFDRAGKQLLSSQGYRLTTSDIIPWHTIAAPRPSYLPGLSIFGLGTTEYLHGGDYYALPFGKKADAFYPARHNGISLGGLVTDVRNPNIPAGFAPVTAPPAPAVKLITDFCYTLTPFGNTLHNLYNGWTRNGINLLNYSRSVNADRMACIRPLEMPYLIERGESLIAAPAVVGMRYRNSTLPVGLTATELARADYVSWNDRPDRATGVNSINKWGTSLTRNPQFASAAEVDNNTCRLYSPFGQYNLVLGVTNPSAVWSRIARIVYVHLDKFVHKYTINAPIIQITKFGVTKSATKMAPYEKAQSPADKVVPTPAGQQRTSSTTNAAPLFYMPGGVRAIDGPKKPVGGRALPTPPISVTPPGRSAASELLAKRQKDLDAKTQAMQLASDATDKALKAVEEEQERERKKAETEQSTAGASASIAVEAAVLPDLPPPVSDPLPAPVVAKEPVEALPPPSPPVTPPPQHRPVPMRPITLPTSNPLTPDGKLDIAALNTMPAMRLNMSPLGAPHATKAWMAQRNQLHATAALTGGKVFD